MKIDNKIDSNEAMEHNDRRINDDRRSTIEKNIGKAWMPDLFGPVFKKHNLTVKEVRSEFSAWCLFVYFSINIQTISFLIF